MTLPQEWLGRWFPCSAQHERDCLGDVGSGEKGHGKQQRMTGAHGTKKQDRKAVLLGDPNLSTRPHRIVSRMHLSTGSFHHARKYSTNREHDAPRKSLPLFRLPLPLPHSPPRSIHPHTSSPPVFPDLTCCRGGEPENSGLVDTLREPQLGRAGALEDDELGLEEDVAVDGEADAGVGLDPAEAGYFVTSRQHLSLIPRCDPRGGGFRSRSGGLTRRAGRNGRVVHEGARDDGAVGADAERDAGQGRGAGEDVAAVGGAVAGVGDLAVVGGDDVGGEVEEGGAGVGDGVDGGAGEGAGADGVAVGRELPEAVGGVDGHVSDAAGVLGAVDVAEVVVADAALLEVGGEDGGGQALGDGVGEEGRLLHGLDGVDAVEGEAEEAVAGALDELGGDGLGGLDGLAGDGRAADGDGVGVDVAARGGAVAVGDGPGVAAELAGGAGGGGVVERVPVGLGAGLFGREDPALRGGWCVSVLQDVLGKAFAARDLGEDIAVGSGRCGRGKLTGPRSPCQSPGAESGRRWSRGRGTRSRIARARRRRFRWRRRPRS